MKECINCKAKNRDTDIYCRNCGCHLQSNKNYIITNVITVFIVLGMFFMVALFIALYMVTK